MAFSTQKDFFHVPFMNEQVEYECKRECVRLKSYGSSFDDRSWSMDEGKQSRFLSDLVTCQTPVGGGGDGLNDVAAGTSGRGGGALDTKNILASQGIRGGDSLLDCANQNLTRLTDILMQKRSLETELEISNDCLKTAKDENEKIKSIINAKFDSNQAKDFYNKIQQLSGKLNKTEENDLMNVYHKIEDMQKAHELIKAENWYLKTLVEKLARRATLETIPQEPEKSTDVDYLQKQLDETRKTLTLLRKYEDDRVLAQQGGKGNSLLDAESLKGIIKERNCLRDKCKKLNELQTQVQSLQKKAKEADHISNNLTSNLKTQDKYINGMEDEMKRMQSYYEDQCQQSKFNEELCRTELEELRDELVRAKCEGQNSECLQREIACLRNEIMKRDVALGEYDSQYKQLMYKVEKFRKAGYRFPANCFEEVARESYLNK